MTWWFSVGSGQTPEILSGVNSMAIHSLSRPLCSASTCESAVPVFWAEETKLRIGHPVRPTCRGEGPVQSRKGVLGLEEEVLSRQIGQVSLRALSYARGFILFNLFISHYNL